MGKKTKTLEEHGKQLVKSGNEKNSLIFKSGSACKLYSKIRVSYNYKRIVGRLSKKLKYIYYEKKGAVLQLCIHQNILTNL